MMSTITRHFVGLLSCLVIATVCGCAGAPPKMFPVAPMQSELLSGGDVERFYDTDADGRADAMEVLDPSGLIATIGKDIDGDGRFECNIDLRQTISDQCRDLLIILDSVPFHLVRDLWQQGRFRLFHPPGRVIAPFPVMTDVSLAEFFGVSPCPGLESAYFDGERLTSGYNVYAGDGNVPWHRFTDYHLCPVAHVLAYGDPHAWANHELRRIAETYREIDKPLTVGYVVGTSGVGAKFGRSGHLEALLRVDRFCQQLVHDTGGKVRITLMSDHGHNLVRSNRMPLTEKLGEMGYHVSTTLKRPNDVVVPEFGIVTYAAIHTRQAEKVARDVLRIEGVEFTAYCVDPNEVVALGHGGRVRISRAGDDYRYQTEDGDPLRLVPILDALDGGASAAHADDILFEATNAHDYPDVIHQLWRAFHGLVQNAPDVLVSVKDGYHCGSKLISGMLPLAAAHGSLRASSVTGFVMSMAGPVPEVTRMVNLRSELTKLGLTFSE